MRRCFTFFAVEYPSYEDGRSHSVPPLSHMLPAGVSPDCSSLQGIYQLPHALLTLTLLPDPVCLMTCRHGCVIDVCVSIYHILFLFEGGLVRKGGELWVCGYGMKGDVVNSGLSLTWYYDD